MKKIAIALIALGIVTILFGIIIIRNQSRVQNDDAFEDLEIIPDSESVLTTTAPTVPDSLPTVATASEIPLTISSPAADSIVKSTPISVKGITTPRAEVFINDKETVADESGNFSSALTLDEGENLIIVTVNDEEGNTAEKEIVVTYEPAD